MSEKIYKSTLYVIITITLAFSLFLISSDNLSPFTTQATVHKNIANVAPEVSGVISQVNIKNGQYVDEGDLLFSLDQSQYLLAVQQAKAELNQVKQTHQAKEQELIVAQEVLQQRHDEWLNSKTKLTRYQSLITKGLITQQDVDDVRLSQNVAASAYNSAKADIQRINAELLSTGQNAAIELAAAKLSASELDLAHTQVKAKAPGRVTNLQLQVGSYIAQGSPSLFLINEDNSWLSADFNEKGMAYLNEGKSAFITFDALPGQVFNGHIMNLDRAVFDVNNPKNQLATVSNDNRWIREQQKIRTRIRVDQFSHDLIAGARASVIIKNGNPIVDTIANAWIHFVSWFRYLY